MIKNQSNLIIIGLLLSIGSLFILKYATRFTDLTGFMVGGYVIGSLLILWLIDWIHFDRFSWINKNTIAILLFAITIGFYLLILMNRIPVETRVGRLPALEQWLENLLNQKFPYNAPSLPSGFPFLFFLAMPFYFLGDLGYLEIVGFFGFWFTLILVTKSIKLIVFRLALLLLLPMFYYEILTRSELFTNMVLVIIAIFLSEKFLKPDQIDVKFISIAILFGLLLSTRLVVGLVYVIYILYVFKHHLLRGVIFSGIIFLTFILTLLPFVIWNSESFFQQGPFAIQSSYMPTVGMIVFALLTIYVGWNVKCLHHVFFSAGATLFAIVLFSLLRMVKMVGFDQAIFASKFDISYFIFCVPFFIFSINSFTENDYDHDV